MTGARLAAILAVYASAAPAAPKQPYRVVFRGPAAWDLCVLAGRPKRFGIEPSLGRWRTEDKLRVECGGQELALDFLLDARVPAETPGGGSVYDFRWGIEKFKRDAALCERARKLMLATLSGSPRSATIHLMNAGASAECMPDALWGTSLNIRLILNQPTRPLSKQEQLERLRPREPNRR